MLAESGVVGMSLVEEEPFLLRTLVEQGFEGVAGRGRCKCKGPGAGRNKVGSRDPERTHVSKGQSLCRSGWRC